MIPREILKKIRQIELRTNRLASQSSPGARLCEPQHSPSFQSAENFEDAWPGEAAAGRRTAVRFGARASARFTVRPSAGSETNPPIHPIRTLKRRERRAPQTHARIPLGFPEIRAFGLNSKPIDFDGFGNCGKFATIKNQVGKPTPFLIPSNSTGLETIQKRR